MEDHLETSEPRRTAYAWGEELGVAAGLLGALAHLHGSSVARLYTRDEFEEELELLHTGRWG